MSCYPATSLTLPPPPRVFIGPPAGMPSVPRRPPLALHIPLRPHAKLLPAMSREVSERVALVRRGVLCWAQSLAAKELLGTMRVRRERGGGGGLCQSITSVAG